jgi:hypothetical protein
MAREGELLVNRAHEYLPCRPPFTRRRHRERPSRRLRLPRSG